MNWTQWTIAVSIGLFVAMVACVEAGFRIGSSHSRQNSSPAHEGIGAIEAGIFGLLGLLLAFSFAGGTSRLDMRRELIVHESNAIGTAYLRLDLLPSEEQPPMRHLFREYLDSRLQVYEHLSNPALADQSIARVGQLQQQIWTRAVASAKTDSTQSVSRLLLPALNEMIDVTTARMIALRTNLPALIFALLVVVALLSGVLAGYAMTKRQARSWLHIFLYAATVAFTVYTVIDLDNPRSGFIRLDAADAALRDLRNSIQ